MAVPGPTWRTWLGDAGAKDVSCARPGIPWHYGELTHTWVTTDRQVAVNGDVCVISKTHALEPFELPAMDQAGFWTEAIFVAERASYCTR
jgi:hypothetical protein